MANVQQKYRRKKMFTLERCTVNSWFEGNAVYYIVLLAFLLVCVCVCVCLSVCLYLLVYWLACFLP